MSAIDTIDRLVKQRVTEAGWVLSGDPIGGGGGGDVYLCFKTNVLNSFIAMVQRGNAGVFPIEKEKAFCEALKLFHSHFITYRDGIAAIKFPKKIADDTAGKRLKREINAMSSVTHPALIKLLDHDKVDRPCWFVMEYHPLGDLAKHVAQYKGKILETLSAIRPIAEGLALLHKESYVHRDVKPTNIFVATNGQLVLGDFGIVFPTDSDQGQLTTPGSLQFSRDWIPDFAMFREQFEYPSTVDVEMFAKVIYYMITGGQKVKASLLSSTNFDLRKRFPDMPGVDLVQEFLVGCMNDGEGKCKYENAAEMLLAMDKLRDTLTSQSHPALILNLPLTHSSIYLPIPMTGGKGFKEMYSTNVLMQKGCRKLKAVARVATVSENTKAQIRFKIGNKNSSEVGIMGMVLEPGQWTSEMEFLATPSLDETWYEVVIEGYATQTGAKLTGFNLYTI